MKKDCKRKGMPAMACPNCIADFYYLGEKRTEEGSYWIDEDEPSSVLNFHSPRKGIFFS